MKKVLAIGLSLVLCLSLAACGDDTAASTSTSVSETSVSTEASTEVSTEVSAETTEGVMTYAEFRAADIDSEVTVECYVQATQSWWEDTINVYAMDAEEGGYFIYNLACSEDDAAKLTAGTKIRVSGFKSEWSGEVEITDGTFEFVDGDTYVAEALDVTDLMSGTAISEYMNRYVSFSNVKVVAADENGSGFLYSWDGSGSHDSNSDLYFNVTIDGTVYSFTVESYLCDNTTDVYAAVEALQPGDIVNMTGFLYWYNGANPHITSVEVVDHVDTYDAYTAADIDAEVYVDTFVQATQSWWDGAITVYTQDESGAYFLYSMPCSEDDAANLVPGTRIRVKGYKSEWSGEVEIIDIDSFEIIDGYYVAEPEDVTALLGTDELADYMNRYVAFTDLTVAAQEDGSAFLYNWDGSGSHDSNSDLYFSVESNGTVYSFTVESYLCDNTSDVYAAVEALNVGDTIDCEGFLYWYNGANPHVTSVTVQ